MYIKTINWRDHHIAPHKIWIQINWPNSDPIKIDTFWMSRFEFQNKICNLSLVFGVRWNLAIFKKIWWYNSWHIVKHRSYFDEIRTKPWKTGTKGMSYQMLKSSKHPDFLWKCQIEPNFQDQWQNAKFILKFKSTGPWYVILYGIRVGSVH